MVDLGVLPGDTSSQARRITDNGLVVGSSSGLGVTHAFLWSRQGGLQDIGALPGSVYAEALDANSSGKVVGASQTSLGGRAFIWSRGSGVQDLNSLVASNLDIVLVAAVGINERNQIVAIGSLHHDLTRDRQMHLDDESHAGPLHVFLLTSGSTPQDTLTSR